MTYTSPITWRASARAKISPAHRAEILLRLHSKFQSGRKIENWEGTFAGKRFTFKTQARAQVHVSARTENLIANGHT